MNPDPPVQSTDAPQEGEMYISPEWAELRELEKKSLEELLEDFSPGPPPLLVFFCDMLDEKPPAA